MLFWIVNVSSFSLYLIKIVNLAFWLADSDAKKVDGATTTQDMDIDWPSTRASSEIDINSFIDVDNDDEEADDAKIIKDTEKKISKTLFAHSLIQDF